MPFNALSFLCAGQVELEGLTGHIEFNSKGQRSNYALRIMQNSRDGLRQVGASQFWHPYSTSHACNFTKLFQKKVFSSREAFLTADTFSVISVSAVLLESVKGHYSSVGTLQDQVKNRGRLSGPPVIQQYRRGLFQNQGSECNFQIIYQEGFVAVPALARCMLGLQTSQQAGIWNSQQSLNPLLPDNPLARFHTRESVFNTFPFRPNCAHLQGIKKIEI